MTTLFEGVVIAVGFGFVVGVPATVIAAPGV